MIKNSFIKNTGVLFSGSVIAQAIGFFITMVLSRIYSPEDFGGLGLFTGMVSVFMVVSGMRYEMAIVVEDDKKKALALTQLSMLFNITTALLLLLVVVLFHSSIAIFFQISNGFWLYLVPLVVCLSGMVESLVYWKNRSRAYQKISSNRIITALSSAAYKVIHPFAIQSGPGLIIGHSIAQVMGLVHLWYRSGIELFSFEKVNLKAAAKKYKSFPLFSAPAALVNILAVKMPIFLLSFYDGAEATGHLDNASRLTYLPMSMLAMASSQVFFERIARVKKDKEQSARVSGQLINFLFALGVIPVVILFVYGDSIIPFVLGGGDKWVNAGVYVQILILFYFAIYLTAPFSSAFEAYGKLKVQLAYNVAFLLLTTAALWVGFTLYDSTVHALILYAATGLIMRLGILNYFFHLFGKRLIYRSLLGIAITGLLIWLLQMLNKVL